MKTTLFTLMVLALCLFPLQNAKGQTPEETQKAWAAYMTPSEMHKMMAEEVGTWKADMTFWMAPGAPPQESSTTAVIEMILDGRYQKGSYSGNMMGMSFNGMSLLGYDNAAEEFTTIWIDNMGTGTMVMKGTYDPATKSITFMGEMMNPATGRPIDVKEVYTFVDADTRKMEMYDTTGDKEFKSMEIVMTRK